MPLEFVQAACLQMNPEECNIFATEGFDARDYRLIHEYGTGLDPKKQLSTRSGQILSWRRQSRESCGQAARQPKKPRKPMEAQAAKSNVAMPRETGGVKAC